MRTTLPRWLIPFIALVLLLASCTGTEGGGSDTTSTQSTGTTLSVTTADATTTEPEVTTAASPITIMNIGEGLTQGQEGRSTYRCFLDAMLHDAGVAFDFVGSRSAPYDSETYGCPTDFDEDHEAWMSAQVGGMQTDMMTASVESLQPDVALIQLGGYDVWQRGELLVTAERLGLFITGLQAVNPDITLLVASMIPCSTPLPWCTDDYPAFNDAIASFGSLSTDESTVMFVDMYTGISTDLLRSDNLTFTDAGDEVMASRWMAALKESGVISTDD